MHVVVAGAGGVGGYFGSKLATAGQDVTFLARGAHLEAMLRGGLVVRSAVEGHHVIPARAADRLDDVPAADVILVCTKSHHTMDAIDLLRPVVGPSTVVLSLQNGLQNDALIAEGLPDAHVLGGVAYVFASLVSPGEIEHRQLGRILLGERARDVRDRDDGAPIELVAGMFLDAGVPVEVSDDIVRDQWLKYICLVALAGTTALTRQPIGAILTSAVVADLWQRQVEEVGAVARAAGVELPGDQVVRCREVVAGFGPANYSSLYHDLIRGRPLELDALHGHVRELGDRLGVPVPTVSTVYQTLARHRQGTSASPDKRD